MSEQLLVQHCSPTLAGLKTGSLFTCACGDSQALGETVDRWNRRLAGKGLRLTLLRRRNGRALLYLFRPERLRRDLCRDAAAALLRPRGYDSDCAEACLAHLRRRLEGSEEFPHEIGLFLGYPPEDVRGFLDGRTDCTCVGCWKVYGDARAAEKLFNRYRKCTQVYCRQLAGGKPIERLAVAG